jgi:hypothetical protein
LGERESKTAILRKLNDRQENVEKSFGILSEKIKN